MDPERIHRILNRLTAGSLCAAPPLGGVSLAWLGGASLACRGSEAAYCDVV